MKYPRHLKPFTGRLDVAPFAGVFFLLLLFLTLHASFAPVPGIRIRLPTAESTDPPGVANPALTVAVDRQGAIYFDQQIVTEEVLRAKLGANVRESRRLPILVIQADEAARHGTVVRVQELAAQVGIREAILATREPLLPAPGTSRETVPKP